MALDLTGISQAFQGLSIGDAALINLIAVVATLLISIAITRHPNKIIILQLPLAFALNVIGLYVGIIPMIIYAIGFVLSSFSLSGIGDALSSGASTLNTIRNTKYFERTKGQSVLSAPFKGTATGATLFGTSNTAIARRAVKAEEYAEAQTRKAYNKTLGGQLERARAKGDFRTVARIEGEIAGRKEISKVGVQITDQSERHKFQKRFRSPTFSATPKRQKYKPKTLLRDINTVREKPIKGITYGVPARRIPSDYSTDDAHLLDVLLRNKKKKNRK